jgi:hypothetical protein
VNVNTVSENSRACERKKFFGGDLCRLSVPWSTSVNLGPLWTPPIDRPLWVSYGSPYRTRGLGSTVEAPLMWADCNGQSLLLQLKIAKSRNRPSLDTPLKTLNVDISVMPQDIVVLKTVPGRSHHAWHFCNVLLSENVTITSARGPEPKWFITLSSPIK